VLTPAKLHEALRRSIDADAAGLSRAEVDFESIEAV
jgi:osmoprotectant transport system ATP-binding protein